MGVVNPKDLGIPVWMGTRADLRRPEHDIAPSAGVDCIAITTDVICSVVHRKLFCRIDGVVDNSNRVPFFISKEARIVAIEVSP